MPVAMDEMTRLEVVLEPGVILSVSKWKSNSCQQTGRMEDVLIVALNDPRGSRGKWPIVTEETQLKPTLQVMGQISRA